jgi:uncharacterized protein (TIGR02594 family)
MAPRNSRVTPDVQTRSPARVFAQSLDTFYAPARDTRKEAALQNTLGAFSNMLGQRAGEIQEERREGFYQQGVADALREEAGGELKGVKTGTIFRQHSRFYEQGFGEQKGKAAALKFKNQITTEYENWDGRFSDDPDAFRSWYAAKSGEFLESISGNKHMLNAALPVINEVSHNMAVKHTAFTNERIKTEHFDAYQSVLGDMFTGYMNGDMDQEALVDAIVKEADEMYQMEGGAANESLVDAAIMWSNTFNNMAGIEAIALAVGKGKLKLNPAQMERLANATDAVEADIAALSSKLTKQQQDEREALEKNLRDQLWVDLDADPDISVRDWMKEKGVTDEAIYRELVKTKETVGKARADNAPSDGENMIAFTNDWYMADTIEEKREVLRTHAPSLSKSEVKEYQKILVEMENGSFIFGDDIQKSRRDNWLDLVTVVEDGVIDVGQTGEVRATAEFLYDRLMVKYAKGVDPDDAAALDQVHERVTKEVNDRLVRLFPSYVENAMSDTSVAGAASGASQAATEALIEEERKLAEEQLGADALRTLEETQPQPEGETLEGGGGVEQTPAQIRGGRASIGVYDTNQNTGTTETPQEGVRRGGRGGIGVYGGDATEGGDGGDMLTDNVNERVSAVENLSGEEMAAKPDAFYAEIMRRFTDGEDTRTSVAPGTIIETGKRYLGMDENAQYETLRAFLEQGGQSIDPRKMPWCAAYVNATLYQNGMDGTGKLNARSFLDWGTDVQDPQPGDVVVLWRESPDSWKGHVGFFNGYDENGNVLILGGNQGNKVSVGVYPANRILGFRRAPGATAGDTAGNIQKLAKDPKGYMPAGAFDVDAD